MAHMYLVEHLAEDARTAEIVGDEARHAIKVARIRVGENIDLADGRGRRTHATVTAVEGDRVVCECDLPVDEIGDVPGVMLVQALAKGDRDELAIQTATELGVGVVVAWQAERSISRWVGDKATKGVERWRSIVRETAKQSLRATIPDVHGPVVTKHLVGVIDDAAQWVVLDPRAATTLTDWAATADPDRVVVLVVGPEGGISDDEMAIFRDMGATPVNFGPHVLRTSTAGPAAIAALRALMGRW